MTSLMIFCNFRKAKLELQKGKKLKILTWKKTLKEKPERPDEGKRLSYKCPSEQV